MTARTTTICDRCGQEGKRYTFDVIGLNEHTMDLCEGCQAEYQRLVTTKYLDDLAEHHDAFLAFMKAEGFSIESQPIRQLSISVVHSYSQRRRLDPMSGKGYTAAQVRHWARAQGKAVHPTGQLSQSLVDDFIEQVLRA